MQIILLSFVILFSSLFSLRITSLDEDARRDACRNFDLTYMNQTTITTLHQYVMDLQLKYTKGEDFFLNLLLTGKFENLKALLDDLFFYLFFIVLAVVALISWIVFCICQCCKCCLFNRNVYKGKCGLVMFIVVISMFGVIFILTSIGFGESITFIKYFNGSTCSFLSFFSHALSGDNNPELPKWVGVKGVQLALNGAADALTVINSEYDKAFQDHTDKLVKPLERYKDNIANAKTTFENDMLGPHKGSIKPYFVKQFTSITDPNILLTSINNEYLFFLLPSITILTKLQEISLAINQITNFSQDLKNLGLKFQDIEILLDDMINKLADNFIALQDNIASIVILIFNIIYGFFMALSLSIIVFLSLYSFMKIYWLKYVMNAIWHICFLFIAFCFILGSLIGVIGFCGKKLIPVVDYILSPEYLTSPDSIFGANQATAINLNSCINGDGDLFTSMKGSRENTEKLNIFYKLSIELGNIEKSLAHLASSAAVPKFQTHLDGYLKDMTKSTDTSYNKDDLSTAINDLNTLTNNGCSGTNDVYILKDNECPSGYTLYSSGEPTSGNYCYLIDSRLNPKVYNDPCDSSIASKIKNIKTYVENSINKIKEMKEYLNNNFDDLFKLLMSEIKNTITNTKIMTASLGSIIAPIIGSHDFFDMFNCSFIKVDLIIFVDQLFNNFCNSCQLVAIDCFISSLLAYISTYFLIKAILHYSKEAREICDNANDTSDQKKVLKIELSPEPVQIASIPIELEFKK